MWLNAVGGLLEISGFGLVAYELFRTQRREFGDPWALALLKKSRDRGTGFVRRLFGRTRTVSAEADLTVSYGIAGSIRAKKRRDRGKTLEDHLAAVEKNFAELDQEVSEHRAELDEAIQKVRDELRETRTELERQREAREGEEKEFLRTSVTLQWWGIGLFVAGVIASVFANVITCG